MSDDAQRPVFVLTMARSGSTLLRFILDSHPDLACPAETNVGRACAGLARLWGILRPSPDPAGDDFRLSDIPEDLPPGAAASIRTAVGEIYSDYTERHGKRRWCDKSLDNALTAGLLACVYPDAQFVCLYRHCMDVVFSAVEAAPWGLNGYGFEPYVAGSPGNVAMAAARCWLDHTNAIIDFQDNHMGRCHGIRYEDLVTDPEMVAAGLFEFLGLDPVPGISSACFAQAHDARGPSDHKIWFTGRVSRDSLGRGVKVPPQMLPPEFRTALNETLDRLAYRQVDDDWQQQTGPADPRADASGDARAVASEGQAEGPEPAELTAAAGEISHRLTALPRERAREFGKLWPAAGQCLAVVIEPSVLGAPARRWLLAHDGDSALTVRTGTEPTQEEAALITSAGTWLALLRGDANVAVELRAGRLRFLDPAHDGPAGRLSPATHLLAQILGLAAMPEQAASAASAIPPAEPDSRKEGKNQQPARAKMPVTGR